MLERQLCCELITRIAFLATHDSLHYSSAAIKRIQLLDDIELSHRGLAYFFSSFTDQQTQDPQSILGSFLVQLCEADPRLWSDIDDRYRKRQGRSLQETGKLNVQELTTLIIQCSERLSSTFLILDALNESKRPSYILSILLEMTKKTKYLRIMISSTEELGTNLNLSPVSIVTMEQESTDIDIRNYIEAQLQESDELLNLPIALKEDIMSTLQGRADGMYHTENPERNPS